MNGYLLSEKGAVWFGNKSHDLRIVFVAYGSKFFSPGNDRKFPFNPFFLFWSVCQVCCFHKIKLISFFWSFLHNNLRNNLYLGVCLLHKVYWCVTLMLMCQTLLRILCPWWPRTSAGTTFFFGRHRDLKLKGDRNLYFFHPKETPGTLASCSWICHYHHQFAKASSCCFPP